MRFMGSGWSEKKGANSSRRGRRARTARAVIGLSALAITIGGCASTDEDDDLAPLAEAEGAEQIGAGRAEAQADDDRAAISESGGQAIRERVGESSPASSPASAAVAPIAEAKRTIVIDGAFDDWEGIDPVWVGLKDEPASSPARLLAAPHAVSSVAAAHDDSWVYLHVAVPEVINFQGIDGTLRLEIDLDGQPLTGVVRSAHDRDWERTGLAGVDAQIEFSPLMESGEPFGVRAAILEKNLGATRVNPYAFDASFAPTYAGDRIEMRIRRGATVPGFNVEAFAGESARARLVWLDREGREIGFTDPFTIDLGAARVANTKTNTSSNGAAESGQSWRRAPYGAVRIMSWNVQEGALFKNPAPFARVINALNPRVIAFQELGRDATARGLRGWLDEHARAPEGWETYVTPETGTGIATRLASAPTGPRAMVSVAPDGRPLRAAMTLIGYGGRRIILTSAHLTCCGRMGDERDQRRVAEANEIRRMLAEAVREDQPAGMLVMGDFNLVGSREPLDILLEGTDLNETDMRDIAPLRFNETTNTTWRDPGQPFLPGRLDFAVVSDSTTEILNAFVFDTELLDDETISTALLEPDDTTVASDHLPIVIDVRW